MVFNQIILKDGGGGCRIMQNILFPKIKLLENCQQADLLNKYFCWLGDSYSRQDIKLEYMPEDSLPQPNYVPLPTG